jgi:D-alanyl-D-alanine carboxypeptidase
MRHRHIPLCALVLGLVATVAGQPDQTDDYIRAEMRKQKIPGLSLAVLKAGKVLKAEGYGFANIKLKIPATPETVYKIASASKQFIATGIMLLVQEGRLGFDDPIGKYLEGTPGTWNGITIRHLLTHTSGLVREAPGFDPLKIQSDADVIRTAYPLPLRFAPGEKWEYSNTGYFALAEIIRTVAGRPWSEYLAEKVFRPTGMLSTRTTTTDSVPNFAQGYVDNDAPRDAAVWPALRPSGAFLSTVLDLAKWDAALYTDDILSASTRRQMWSPVTLNDGSSHPYGFGWMVAEVRGHRFVHHRGGMPGFRADIARFVDEGLTIIVLMNLDDVDIDTIVRGLANIYLPARAPSRDSAEERPLRGAGAPMSYSPLNATTGSTRTARRAGIHDASNATIASAAGTSTNVSGSLASTPKSSPDKTCVSAKAPAMPIARPAPASFIPPPSTIRSTARRSAPRAIRIPISCVRCAVAYASTP